MFLISQSSLPKIPYNFHPHIMQAQPCFAFEPSQDQLNHALSSFNLQNHFNVTNQILDMQTKTIILINGPTQ